MTPIHCSSCHVTRQFNVGGLVGGYWGLMHMLAHGMQFDTFLQGPDGSNKLKPVLYNKPM